VKQVNATLLSYVDRKNPQQPYQGRGKREIRVTLLDKQIFKILVRVNIVINLHF